jgi:hypothetical protein
VPIYVEKVVLDNADIFLDTNTGKPLVDEKGKIDGKDQKVTEEELKRMSAFRDFIDQLDLDDFGKRKS